MTSRSEKCITRKLQANVSNEHWCKSPQLNVSKQNSTTHKKIIPYKQMRFISCQASLTYVDQSMLDNTLTKWKVQNIWLSQSDTEEAFDKVQHSIFCFTFKIPRFICNYTHTQSQSNAENEK